MRFEPTAIAGAFVVHLDMHEDERGGFGRIWCPEAFAAEGVEFRVAQANLSRNRARHTLRGMHGQAPPHEEAKLVQCVRGRIHDVAVDLRPESRTRGSHVAIELSADSNSLFLIPAGCAHGFLTLEPDSDLIYFMGTAFVPGVAVGYRWNDPAFGIAWPAEPAVMSERDAGWPDFDGFAE